MLALQHTKLDSHLLSYEFKCHFMGNYYRILYIVASSCRFKIRQENFTLNCCCVVINQNEIKIELYLIPSTQTRI